MASPSVEFLRSPFEKAFQILPQGHDKALKQAFYNTAASLFVVLICGAGVAVYYILQAFLRPLLWAALCGTFLHPCKNKLTTLVQTWLASLRKSGTPFLLGTLLLPFQVVDSLSEAVGAFISTHFKVLLAVGLGLPASYLIYYFGPVQQILGIIMGFFYFLYEALGYFSAIWVWSLAVAYILLVIFFWTPQSSALLRGLAVPVWLALLFHAVTVTGPLRVPLLIAVVTFMIIGFITEVKHTKKSESGNESPSLMAAWRIWSSDNISDPEGNSVAPEPGKLEIHTSTATTEDVKRETSPPRPTKLEDKPRERGGVDSCVPKPRPLSDTCFIVLFWGVGLVLLWKNMWIIQLIPLLFVVYLMKRLGTHLGAWQFIQYHVTCLTKRIQEDARFDILAPRPVRGFAKLMLRGDHKIVLSIEQSMDKAISILIVLSLFIGVIFMVFFSAVQVHRESMHLVTVSSNVLNNSVHPELNEWLPNSEDMQEAMDSMVGNAYIYGRQWLADKVNSALNGDAARKENVEKQVLEIWDRIYENYFVRNTSKVVPKLRRRNTLVDLTNVSNIWNMVEKAEEFDLNIMDFLKENIGTFLALLESVWQVLKGNLNLVISLLTATISIVFGGGTAILNFVLSAVVFITTLFYLLASSKEQYKPVQWFSSMSPSQGPGAGGSKFGKAVEEAISSVFVASFKMAAFYGLYTWLIHSAFGVQIVFIPSALAAMFAAIPFLGTYWAALPGILELWLVNGEGVQALLFVICSFLPTYFVDTAIYSEIKGGHPFMTGLAIAGGMLWLGLEGAIIGPVLLCCLVVAMNVYTSILSSDISPESPAPPVSRGRSSATSKKVTFDERQEK